MRDSRALAATALDLYARLATIESLWALSEPERDELLTAVRALGPDDLDEQARHLNVPTLFEEVDLRQSLPAWGDANFRAADLFHDPYWNAVYKGTLMIPGNVTDVWGTAELLLTPEERKEWLNQRSHQDTDSAARRSYRKRKYDEWEESWEQDPTRTLLRFTLGRMHVEARCLIYYPLKVEREGEQGWGPTVLPQYLRERVEHQLVPEKGVLTDRHIVCDLFHPGVLELRGTANRPQFGLCATCEAVFVRKGRGRPRSFCDRPMCKAKGIPSAAKRNQYQRAYRRRLHDEELDKACKIVRKFSGERQFTELGMAFPRKLRGQLLKLQRAAQERVLRAGARAGRNSDQKRPLASKRSSRG